MILAIFASSTAFGQTEQPYIAPSVTSTEGYDFMVAYLPNSDRAMDAKDLRLQLLISSRPVEGHPEITENIVGIDYGDGTSAPDVTVPVGQTKVVDIDAKKAYWDITKGEVEQALPKGVHVYSKSGVKMTVYAANQIGTDIASFSFDGAHVLPRQALGHEYIIECNSSDEMSTEFVIMSTKSGTTTVTINLPAGIKTSTGKTKLTARLTKPYQIYIVRSLLADPNKPETKIDLSGTTICADQPIAVWGGNQASVFPTYLPGTSDHTYDQLLPIDRWGKQFVVPLTGMHMQINKVDIVARDNETRVTVTSAKGAQTRTLSSTEKWERLSEAPGGTTLEDSILVIDASAPIQVYLYTSSSIYNLYYKPDGTRAYEGDPSMTMASPIEYLTDSMIFTTFSNNVTAQSIAPLAHELVIWAKSSAINSIKLNGTAIPANQFKALPGGAPFNTLKYARVSINPGTYTLTSKGKDFGGYVYGLEQGQAYLYPVGYTYLPHEDSLFLADEVKERIVHRSEYSKKYPDKGGWYLNREVLPTKAPILDSIFVCDSATLRFPMKVYNQWDEIKWEIFRVDPRNQKRNAYTDDAEIRKEAALPNPFLETMFTLLPEKNLAPNKRHQFEDFEVRAVLYRAPKLCGQTDKNKWQKDTLNTIVRVYRYYNDTTWYVKCTADKKFEFFYDDPTGTGGSKTQRTTYYCQENSVPEGVDPKWNIQLHKGENEFVKQYTSVNGCDSFSVLRVFVCETYNFETDVRTLCEEELPALNEEYGRFFTENNPINFAETLKLSKSGQSRTWTKENAGTWRYIGKSTLKTTGCNDAIQEYIQHGVKFNGCDSIKNIELHVIPMEIIDYGRVTYCGTTYTWKDKNGNVLDEIAQTDVGTEHEYTKPIYYVSPDTWKNCPMEMHVIHLAFVTNDIPLREPVEMCEDDEPRHLTRKDVKGEYSWDFDPKGQGGKIIKGDTWDFTNSEGCAYKFYYEITVYPAPKHPTETTVLCSDEEGGTVAIDWPGHPTFWWNKSGDTKQTRSESIITSYPAPPVDKDHDTRLIFDLIDTLTTSHGCHDIYSRTVIVMPKYTISDSRPSMTTEDSFSWEGITWAGEDATVSGSNVVKLVPEGGTYPAGWDVTYDEVTMTYIITSKVSTQPIGGQVCDSTISMTVQVGRPFHDTVYTYTCAGAETYYWEDHPDVNIPLPKVNELTKPKLLIVSDEQKTTYPVPGLDSIWVLYLTVYPAYNFPHEDNVCQSMDGYKWTDHMGEGHDLWINGSHMDKTWDSIPTSRYGVFSIEDKMQTKVQIYTHPVTGEKFPVECDSSEVLTLTVNPVYSDVFNPIEFNTTIQSHDTVTFFTEPKSLYIGADFDYAAHGTSLEALQAEYGAENVHVITTTEDVQVVTVNQKVASHLSGCDSTTFFNITVLKAKYTNQEYHLGDNNTTWSFGGNEVDEYGNPIHTQSLVTGEYFHFHYDEYGNIIGPVNYGDPNRDSEPIVYEFRDTIKTALGADSIIVVTVTVYPTYRIFEKQDTTCHSNKYDWEGHPGFEDLNKLLPDSITMIREISDTLCVTRYNVLGKDGKPICFDSIRVLPLMILPGEEIIMTRKQCMNEVVPWREKEIKYNPQSVITEYSDIYAMPGFEECEQKYHLYVTWYEAYGLEGSIDYEDWVDERICCQHDDFRWLDKNGKEHKTNLRDKSGTKYDKIPTDEVGWITIYDSLKTKECRCDSVYTLRLYVAQSYQKFDTINVCLGDVVTWDVNEEVQRIYEPTEIGDFDDAIMGQTAVGSCDSSYYLHYHVDRTYWDTLPVTLCAKDEHFVWHDKVYDAYIADSRNWTEPKEFFQQFDTVTKVSGCDSTVILHLIIGPSKDSIWTDTICVGETYFFDNQYLTEEKEYTTTIINEWGCQVNLRLNLRVFEPTAFTLAPDAVCMVETGEGESYILRYIYKGEFAPVSYSIYYDQKALDAGFFDQTDVPITTPKADHIEGVEQELNIAAPIIDSRELYPRPDHYGAKIAFNNGVCQSDSLMTYTIDIVTNYPSWITEQRFGDVIALLNDGNNGGYTWTQYQWYKGDTELPGQTQPYLYIPTGLEVGAQYHVVLTREGENEAFASCPITIIPDPATNKYAPSMGYLSVVPTCVAMSHPYIHILSRKDGTYRVTTTDGKMVKEGTFRADVTEVQLPQTAGMYVVQLWSYDTPEEPYRAIKIVIRDKCETCATSF